MEDNYIEFINNIKKVNKSRVSKITGSFGVYDYFKYYRKNKPVNKNYLLDSSTYYKLIRKINKRLIEVLFEEGQLKFPSRMGMIVLERFDVLPKIDSNGNLFYPAPIDWGETLKLWHEDEEAFDNKIKVKKEIKHAYKITYRRDRSVYNNKYFYNIKFNRELKKLLNIRDKEGKLNISFKNKKAILK